MVHEAGEHARAGAAQPRRVEAGGLERLPRRLQQQPLLRVHGDGLAGRDAEERGVEPGRPGEEAALPGVRGAGVVGVVVEEVVEVPAPVGGELADAVAPGGQQLPQLVRALHPARIPAGHPHDGDRLIHPRGHRRVRAARNFTGELLVHVPRQRRRRRIVEHQRRSQPQPGSRVHPVTQIHRRQRVETQLPERPVHRHRLRAAMPQHLRHQAPDQQRDLGPTLVLGEPGESAGPTAGARLAAGRRGTDERGQHRRHRRAGGRRAQRGQVDHRGHQDRPVRAQGGVEQLQPDLDAHRRQAGPSRPRPVRLGQRRRHAGGVPHPPRQADRRQTRLPAIRGQRVQEPVARGVGGLTRRAEHPRDGREHHEQVQIQTRRGLVQPPTRRHLRRQHTRQPFRADRRHHTVVQHTGGVHHTRQPARRGHLGHQPGHLLPVRHVTRDHPRRRAQTGQPLDQRVRARGGRPLPRHQQQRPHPVRGDQTLRHQRAQRPRAAGDQHRAVAEGRRVPGRRHCGPDQARDQHLLAAQRHLRPSGRQVLDDASQHRENSLVQVPAEVGRHRADRLVRIPVEVGQHDAVRVLRLGRAEQPPHRGAGQVGDPVVVPGRHRAAGQHHQPRVGQRVRGQPRLHHREHVRRRRPDRRRHVDAGQRRHRQDQHPGDVRSRLDCGEHR
ncbi:hypothetical protein B0E53_06635 [Micromonospora sp. MH33]|nr:hypothetical protein B0E53_06635 [Micromonospora sp. MH33]